MGVRGLETLMKTKVPNGTCVFYMEAIIKHQREVTGKEVVLVIDVEGMLNCFVSKREMLCGLRSDVYNRRVRAFFQRLVDAGAKLVFFSDGPVQNDKQTTWLKRQNDKYNEYLALIDKLDKHIPLRDLVKESVPNTTMVASLIRDLAKDFGYVTTSIQNECDLELAAFATENNAFAIFADDSDFLIYPGEWRYWSIREINDEHMTTLAYNKAAFRAYLGLSPEQLPLFANLGGNDIVQWEDIKDFHQRIGWKDKFENIAHYVRPLPLKLTDKMLDEISSHVFSHKSDWKKYKDFIKTGLEIYDYKSIAPPNHLPFHKKLLDNRLKTVYVILKEYPFSITAMYDDMRDLSKKNYSELSLELRSKTVGVIMKHRNDPNLQMKAVIKMTHEEPYRQIYFKPKYPEIDVPPLENLLFPKDENEMKTMTAKRKELLQWILCGAKNILINTDSLFALPKEYILPVTALFYLVKEANFPVDIADMILLSIFYSFTLNDNLNDTKPPQYLLKDAFLASFLYLKMHNFMKRVFKIIGLKEYAVLVKFDGYVFHQLHQESPLWDATTRSAWLHNIQHLRLYA